MRQGSLVVPSPVLRGGSSSSAAVAYKGVAALTLGVLFLSASFPSGTQKPWGFCWEERGKGGDVGQ